ncbi:EthD domain-containing protein [Sphingobium faniae]|nr:EthD domain-containing protein [Sphingobium faniae]
MTGASDQDRPGTAACSQILLGLRLREGEDRERVKARVHAALDSMTDFDSAGCATGCPVDLFAGSKHGLAVRNAPSAWDVAVWVESRAFDCERAAELIQPLQRLVADHAVTGDSVVIAGICHTILPGPDMPLLNLFALRPLPGMSAAQFRRHWFEEHGALAVKGRKTTAETRRYRQLHADADVSAKIANALHIGISDFIGAAQSNWASVEQMRAAFLSPAVGDTALDDERRFINHGRSVLGAYDVARFDAGGSGQQDVEWKGLIFPIS